MADKKNTSMEEVGKLLEEGVKNLFTTEQYKVYLNTMSKFHQYSFNNTVLIAQQNKEATLVAGYKSWEKNFNRHVKQGEKGIRIIAPVPVKHKVEQTKRDESGNYVLNDAGVPQTEEIIKTIPRFRTVTVFDVSQTEGEPLPERPGVQTLTAEVDSFDSFMRAIQKISPVPIRYDDIEGTANGYFDPTNKEIVIRKGLQSESQIVKTAIHEVVHARLHDPDMLRERGQGRVNQTTREIEAESVAYLVCHQFNIDSSDYTFPYVAAWSSSVEMKELRESMSLICDTATKIIDDLTAQLEMERVSDKESVTLDKPETPDKETVDSPVMHESVSPGRTVGNVVYAPAFDNGQWKVTEIDLTKVRWTGSLMEHNGLVYDRNRDMYTTEDAAWKSIYKDPAAYRDLVKFDVDHKPYLANGQNQNAEKYHEDNPLPPQCYSVLPSTGEVIIVKRGESGYYRTTAEPGNREANRELADKYNAKLGITREQEDILVAGSMFGMDEPERDREQLPMLDSLPDRETVESLREEYPPGTRVELLEMNDPQAPPEGTKGTVRTVDDMGTIHVSWDNGSGLGVAFSEDTIRKTQEPEKKQEKGDVSL